jgi:hypothetical protein
MALKNALARLGVKFLARDEAESSRKVLARRKA